MEENKAIVPYEKGGEVAKAIEGLTKITDEDFYKVWRNNKWVKIPSARALQRLGLEERISTELLEVEKTDNYAKAIVRGWIGNKDHPEVETTECVWSYLKDIEAEWLVQNLTAKGDKPARSEFNKELNRFVPKGDKETIEMLKYIARRKLFLERDVITKAKRRVFDQLLGFEWRDKEEIEAEKEEVETVQDSIKNQPTTNGASEKQIDCIKDLTANNNGKADIAREFLQVLGKEYLSQLSSTEASELITKLKA